MSHVALTNESCHTHKAGDRYQRQPLRRPDRTFRLSWSLSIQTALYSIIIPSKEAYNPYRLRIFRQSQCLFLKTALYSIIIVPKEAYNPLIYSAHPVYRGVCLSKQPYIL